MTRHLAQTCLSVLMKHDLELNCVLLNSFGHSGLVKTKRKIQKKGQYVTIQQAETVDQYNNVLSLTEMF